MSILERIKGFKMDEFKNVQMFETGTFCPFRSRISPKRRYPTEISQHNEFKEEGKYLFSSKDFI
jgi:hypothetical protein